MLPPALLFALALGGSSPSFAQTKDDDVIKVETNLVQVPVVVRKQDGSPVLGLTAQNFRLSYGGAPQTVEFFGEQKNLGLALAVIVDLSQSIHGQRGAIAEATKELLESMDPKRDKVLIEVIGSHCTQSPEDYYYGTWKTPSREYASFIHGRLKACEKPDSWILLSIQNISYYFKRQDPGTPRTNAVIAISDFADTRVFDYGNRSKLDESSKKYHRENFQRSLDDVEKAYRAEGVSLYAVVARGGDYDKYSKLLGFPESGEGSIQFAAESAAFRTGGRSYRDSVGSMGNLYKKILQDLKGHYSLGFAPDGAFDKAKAVGVKYAQSGGPKAPAESDVAVISLR